MAHASGYACCADAVGAHRCNLWTRIDRHWHGRARTVFGRAIRSRFIKSNAIEVGEEQLPDVYYTARICCERLGIQEPIAVYVLQENLWNAFAAKLASRRVVVLLSGALDSILLKGDMNQVTWLIGHEIGHHAAGHFDFLAKFLEIGAWLPWIYLWYSRRRELTCDRIGLYCCGSVEGALLAISNLTVGAQLATAVNVDQAIAQWHRHSHELYVTYRTLYTLNTRRNCGEWKK